MEGEEVENGRGGGKNGTHGMEGGRRVRMKRFDHITFFGTYGPDIPFTELVLATQRRAEEC